VKRGWQTKKLGDVCRFIDYRGKTPQKTTSGLRLVTAKNVKMGYLQEMPREYVAPKSYDGWMTRGIPKMGDVLFTTEAPLANVAQLDTEEKVVFAQRIIVLQPSEDNLDRTFLKYLLLSDLAQHRIHEKGTGATVKGIKASLLKSIPIEFPPLPEQQRIVGILDEAFEGITTAKANAEKNLHNARALFESHLQSVFTQRGKGRVEKRLDEVCTFSSGGTPSKTNSSYWSGEIPWVSGRDMKSTRLSDSLLHISRSAVDESSTRMAPVGTLLILVRGMGLAHGAQIAELMVPCTFNQDIRGIHPEPDLIPRYLLFALRDRINSSDNVLSSAAHGTLKIDSDELKSMMIPVLSRDHQQRIVTTIDSLSEETQRLASLYERKLVALEALKKSLLHQAFTGQL
jgi:type I restriction enzyme S subunit